MSLSQVTIGSRSARLWLARMLVFVCVLRALIPTGFMPDFGAAAEGTIRIVICSASGSRTVDLAQPGGTTLPDKGHSTAQDQCPFAGAPSTAIVAPSPLVLAAYIGADRVVAPAEVDQPAVRRIGPPLGSRAPPA